MNRVIRLKEWGCNTKSSKRPSEIQIRLATSALEDKSYPLNTDMNGFIINSGTVNDPKRECSMVLLGDSFVESLFVDEGSRINSVIERFVPNYRVLNGGYSGATSLHLINVIINKVIPIRPNYVVFFVPTNDQRVQGIDKGYWNRDQRLSPLVSVGKNNQLVDEYPDLPYAKSVGKLLKVVHFLLKNFAIPHCFATTPHRQVVNDDDEWFSKANVNIKNYATKLNQRKKINAICRDFCLARNIDCIDLETVIYGHNDYFYDDLHLTSQSSLIVGDIIFNQLKSFRVV